MALFHDYGSIHAATRAQWTGLPVCVGIGPTKTLAKLANHIAKKNSRFNGVRDLASMDEAQYTNLMTSIDVGEVWGVGRRINTYLQATGIRTVKDLRDTPPTWLRSRFGVVMERTGNELRGISCLGRCGGIGAGSMGPAGEVGIQVRRGRKQRLRITGHDRRSAPPQVMGGWRGL